MEMKGIKTGFSKAIGLLLIFTVICGIIYPLIITGISQLFMKEKANGSMIERNGKVYGSELLGQQYTGKQYLWGRIMNIDTETFYTEDGSPVMYASPSNISPASEEYERLIEERVVMIKEANPEAKLERVPVDLVTCSGSGLDPHISVAAAQYQIPRIAKENHMTEQEVNAMIETYTTGKFLGIFGEEVVNVLEVNLALDGILS